MLKRSSLVEPCTGWAVRSGGVGLVWPQPLCRKGFAAQGLWEGLVEGVVGAAGDLGLLRVDCDCADVGRGDVEAVGDWGADRCRLGSVFGGVGVDWDCRAALYAGAGDDGSGRCVLEAEAVRLDV